MDTTDLSQRQNVLVTGGAGFIGSHLCDALIRSANVICLDDLISGNVENINHLLPLPNFEFIKHDLAEPTNLDVFPELKKFKLPFHGLDEIYHLACPTSHYEKHAHQLATALANSHGTKNALDLAVKYKAKMLLASSAAVYGEPAEGKVTPLKESDLGLVNHLGDRACYDEGKRFAETLATIYREQFRVDIRIMRLFQSYGPRMSLTDNRLVPRLIAKAIVNEPMVVYGSAEDKTSLCYITDIIEAIGRMMQSDIAGPLNIGSETVISYNDIAEKIKEITGSSSSISYDDNSPYIKHRGLPDITLAKEKLGWFPVVSLESGLRLAIDDMRGSQVVRMTDIV